MGLRRRTIDLVREENLREDRTRPKLKRALQLVEHVAAEHVGGHQVGRALKPSKRDTDGCSERPRQGRLADTGDVLEQQVAARQERDDSQLDDFFLAPDDESDVLNQALRRLGRVFGDVRDAVLSHSKSVP